MSERSTGSRAAGTEGGRSSTALFDIRTVIGGLFVLYGVVVTIVGFVDGADAEEQAAGVDINLWSGLAMLAFGIGMLAWMRVSPNAVAAPDRSDAEEGRPPEH